VQCDKEPSLKSGSSALRPVAYSAWYLQGCWVCNREQSQQKSTPNPCLYFREIAKLQVPLMQNDDKVKIMEISQCSMVKEKDQY
jgi:hypothetical protein